MQGNLIKIESKDNFCAMRIPGIYVEYIAKAGSNVYNYFNTVCVKETEILSKVI